MTLPRLFACLSVLIFASLASAAPPRVATDEDVDRTIGEITRFLQAAQRPDGTWTVRHPNPPGGETALALFALLESGLKPSEEGQAWMKKGVDALVALKTDNTYVIAMRTMVLTRLVSRAKDAPLLPQLKSDVAWLIKDLAAKGGAWGYQGPERDGDNSCSQFALLALWEAGKVTELQNELLRPVETTWLRRQQKDGGWMYAGAPEVKAESTLTMTTAGLASLYICQDELSFSCDPYAQQKPMERGWDFLAKNLKPDFYKNGYLAFCIQRIGMASGSKLIGDLDWYAAGAAAFCEPSPTGHNFNYIHGEVVQAAFELLFLSRGRIPLTFNKLQYGTTNAWNVHTRDVARFSDYMGKTYEHRMRWQVVAMDSDETQFLDAPILFVAGTGALDFTPEQWVKLRNYALRGGTLLFVPTHANGPTSSFYKSVKEGLEVAFAELHGNAPQYYKLEPLPASHAIYSVHNKIVNGDKAMPLSGISDGTRLLAIISEKDLAHSWHRLAFAGGKADFDLGANLYFYATGMEPLRTRLRPIFRPITAKPAKIAKIAWMKHDGNWNTQPYGFAYLNDKLTLECGVGIDVETGVPFEPERLKGKDLLWLTGSDEIKLNDQERAALKDYLLGGGTLFVNAVGGSEKFNNSVELVLSSLFAPDNISSSLPKEDSPLFTGKAGTRRGLPMEKLQRTKALRNFGRQDLFRIYNLNGRALVIHAPSGLQDTLDGHTALGAMSYQPGSARDIAENVVLYALMDKPPAPAPAPTTKPAATTPATTTAPTSTAPTTTAPTTAPAH